MLIVKKMPILQGFPDFETVKNLSGNAAEDVNFSPLFYDIETTGLGRNSSFLYLIGFVKKNFLNCVSKPTIFEAPTLNVIKADDSALFKRKIISYFCSLMNLRVLIMLLST